MPPPETAQVPWLETEGVETRPMKRAPPSEVHALGDDRVTSGLVVHGGVMNASMAGDPIAQAALGAEQAQALQPRVSSRPAAKTCGPEG
jgi:hypothetical protein